MIIKFYALVCRRVFVGWNELLRAHLRSAFVFSGDGTNADSPCSSVSLPLAYVYVYVSVGWLLSDVMHRVKEGLCAQVNVPLECP